MLKPYLIFAESETSITYQYSTLYSWILLGLLVFMFVGIFLNNIALQSISAVLIVLYFSATLILGREVTNKIKHALKSGSVEVSGGKYSFSRPLKIKVVKNA